MDDSTENNLENMNVEKSSLSPDHPLLEKFQKALKEHLLSQINRINDDIFENETETKKKNAEREQLGVQAYEAQQMVCKQQKILENLIDDLQNITAAKEEVENNLEKEKVKQKEFREKYYLTEKAIRELQNEIESVNLLVHQMSQWENKIESNISVNQRIAEKTRKDNLQLSIEKREQDLLIYKLNVEIWKLENEIELLTVKSKIKSSELEELEQSVAVGNTNIEALQAEYRCLMHSWNSVVVAISSRDKGLDCINEEVRKLQEKLKSIISETGQLKKLIRKELVQNENLTMIKSRIELDIKKCNAQIDEETNKKITIESTMYELQAIVEQTEKDIEDISKENHQNEIVLNSISKEFDKVATKKFALEEKLIKDLQNQMACDKVASNRHRTLMGIREKKRDVEIIMNEAENKSSLLATEIESQKYCNEENRRLFQDIQKQQADLEKEADYLQEEKEKYELLFRKRERQVDVLNNKLEKASGKPGQSKVSPQEIKITSLEKYIEETQDAIKKLQSFWLREQKNLLVVSKDRQEQIYSINLLKKQTLILEQKHLKIRDEIEAYQKAGEKVIHNINNLQNKSTILCETLFKKRNQKVSLGKSNTLLQSEYECKLKDAELACLQIEADIAEIEEDKINLSREILEVNREVLEWEKKLQLARETMNDMKDERSKGGEVENMKQEIHRMNVIYSQMRKAQEKLIKDLEYCVSRRDSIYTISEARQKKNQSAEDKTRINYTRKMDNIKNKIKQVDNEIKIAMNKIQLTARDTQDLLRAISSAELDVKVFQEYSVDLTEDLEIAKTNRQLNFELLLIQQKKVTMYNDISMGRNPYTVYRKEDQLVSEYAKQKDLSKRLYKIIENLITDFPAHRFELDRISNTLKIGSLSMYP